MLKLINNLQPEVKLNMIKKLQGYGYGDNVYNDEIQAYLATGLSSNMKRIRGIKEAIQKNILTIRELLYLGSPLLETWNKNPHARQLHFYPFQGLPGLVLALIRLF